MGPEQIAAQRPPLPNTVIHHDMSMPATPPPLVSPAYGSFQFDDSYPQSDAMSIGGKSTRSTKTVFEDIKHEIMVNHLYQQQCSRLWVSDGSGEIEGVLLRKSRGRYLSCPQELRYSQFAKACAELNVQVRYVLDLPRGELRSPRYRLL